jgi:hypothetical protein
MNDHDFDDLSALWNQEPSTEEKRLFASLARTVSLRAKLIHYIDLGLALFVAAGLFALFFYQPTPAAAALVLLVIAAIAWSSWKRHELHQVAMILDCSDRQSLLSSALVAAQARLRMSNLSLIMVPPCFLFGIVLRGAREGSFMAFVHVVGEVLSQPMTIAATIFVSLMWLYVARQNLGVRREVARLKTLQEQYLKETRLDER